MTDVEATDRAAAFNRKMDAYVASVVGEDGDDVEYVLNRPDEDLTGTDRDVLQAIAVVATTGPRDHEG